MRIIFYKALG